ncbi:hypothetical protein I7I48_01412 [Histoplasma ohiense]|nr:hypothetical protein I7I48_01412 [Histoplasma ohiense (nom. inval.)]
MWRGGTSVVKEKEKGKEGKGLNLSIAAQDESLPTLWDEQLMQGKERERRAGWTEKYPGCWYVSRTLGLRSLDPLYGSSCHQPLCYGPNCSQLALRTTAAELATARPPSPGH